MRQGLRVFGIMTAQLKRAEGPLVTSPPTLTAHPAREEARLMEKSNTSPSPSNHFPRSRIKKMPPPDVIVAALTARGWSQEGAEQIAYLMHTDKDPKLAAHIARRMVGADVYYRKPATKPKAVIPHRIRKAVFERDAYRCQHCGDWHDLSVDHIHPESKGGTLDLDNLQTLCRSCNSRKGART